MKRLIIAVVLTFSGIIGSFILPFYGLCIYIWFAYMRPQEWAWNASWFMALRPSYTLAICVIVGSAIHAEKLFKANKFSALVFTLWICFLISFVNAVNAPKALFWFDYATKLLVLGFVMGGLINSKRRLVTVVMVLVATLGYYGAKSGLFGILNPSEKVLQGPGGMLGDNNDFALAFNMTLPLIYFGSELIVNPKYNKYKRLLKLMFYLTILGVIFTYSRGGFLGLAFVILAVNIRSRNKFMAIVTTIAFAILVVSVLMPKQYKDRISTIDDSEEQRDHSVKGRIHFWKTAIKIANDYPFTGVGPNCYSVVYDKYDSTEGLYGVKRAVHNSFFQMLADNGYIALILFVTLITLSIKTCFKLRKLARGQPNKKDFEWIVNCANMFEISIGAYCVSGFFLSMAYGDLIYHTFFMVGALEQLTYAQIEAARQKPKQVKFKAIARPFPSAVQK